MKWLRDLAVAVLPACYIFAVISAIFCVYIGITVFVDLVML